MLPVLDGVHHDALAGRRHQNEETTSPPTLDAIVEESDGLDVDGGLLEASLFADGRVSAPDEPPLWLRPVGDPHVGIRADDQHFLLLADGIPRHGLDQHASATRHVRLYQRDRLFLHPRLRPVAHLSRGIA